MRHKSVFLLALLTFGMSMSGSAIEKEKKNRVIILTDIEADPDDTQSLVRLFLYANEIDIKGIVATTSFWRRDKVETPFIRKVIRAYGKVQPNLLRHDEGYPSEQALMDVVKDGTPKYGMLAVGNGQASEGSEWIVQELEKADERPLWISVWGGANTLAQALDKLKETKSRKELKRLVSMLRVYAISDQDDAGIWIRNNFPDLFYIVSPGGYTEDVTWRGINQVVEGNDNSEISNSWLAENIQQAHGPLGAAYPDVSWGMEGDTPAFLHLIPNGLNVPEHPEWGGWGGRYLLYRPDIPKEGKGKSIIEISPETRPIWTNASDTYKPFSYRDYSRPVGRDTVSFTGNSVSLWRWRDDFQNDFAARMDWCLQSYAEANHPPVPVLACEDHLTVKPGTVVFLDASDSVDPDGDHLSFLWFNYPEAGSLKAEPEIIGADNTHALFLSIPEVDKKGSIHMILRLTDKGRPSLSRYKRITIDIEPDATSAN